MPYRPIDLQVSVPRTPETASQQSQMNHRPALEQALLEKDAAKTTEERRSRNAEVEQTGNRGISSKRDRDSRSAAKRSARQNPGQAGQERKDERDEPPHPYKGKHIDVST
ncbi:hypothetical protein SAMN02799624_01212 [Paenibacillus sp. UNC496MF]|uniref:hypothetical protein n=1 Tax=Paenibacillus sp. UNC496MF TaxID=1502753 RepID=UPI0008EE48A4|nr:hypothetical protein [Paenibacillus sp. UNC496MF]SFI52738.1 hypothetical protein SAMN02799624_01212 [Paenibacillus sp. UNC496MF]